MSLPLTLPTQCSLLPWNVAEGSETSCCICQGSAEACRLFPRSNQLVGSQASPQHTSCRYSSYWKLPASMRWEYASTRGRTLYVRSRAKGYRRHARNIMFASRHQPMQAQTQTYQSSTKKNHNNEMFQT